MYKYIILIIQITQNNQKKGKETTTEEETFGDVEGGRGKKMMRWRE